MTTVQTNKPEASKTPAKNPFQVKDGQRAVLLVPWGDSAKDRVAALLDEAGYTDLPKVVQQIKLKKLSENDVIFTAVAKSTKLAQRKQPTDYVLKLSPPIQANKLVYIDAEDLENDREADYGPLVDAVQTAVHPAAQVVVSEDKVLKLL